MKIKNILVSLVATLALAAGCNQLEPDHYLSEVKVSSSFVALNMDGGSASITVDATEGWSIPTAPDWLTISPTSGGAGSANVTFSAGKTLDGRTATVVINCGGKTQNINIIQGLAVVSPATCAEVIAGPDSKTYRVTGICTRIANTNYGNWYLQDATGEIYIYGTVDATGKYNWASFGIEVGDEVTVEGPKTTYSGTVELVDASVIKVNKSLIKVEYVSLPGRFFRRRGRCGSGSFRFHVEQIVQLHMVAVGARAVAPGDDAGLGLHGGDHLTRLLLGLAARAAVERVQPSAVLFMCRLRLVDGVVRGILHAVIRVGVVVGPAHGRGLRGIVLNIVPGLLSR